MVIASAKGSKTARFLSAALHPSSAARLKQFQRSPP
jgi:hypothetical protein